MKEYKKKNNIILLKKFFSLSIKGFGIICLGIITFNSITNIYENRAKIVELLNLNSLNSSWDL